MLYPLYSLLSLISLLNAPRHDFHASVTEMEYNPKTQKLESSARLFTDDLHAALAFHYDSAYHRAQGKSSAMDSLIARYIIRFLQLKGDGKSLSPQYLGREEKVDITYVYLTFAVSEKPAKLEVLNALFFGMFDDQINILNIKWEQWKGSLFIKATQPRETLVIP